jgi:hypothetical protein
VCWGAFGSPERDRLAATITETRIELDSLVRKPGNIGMRARFLRFVLQCES